VSRCARILLILVVLLPGSAFGTFQVFGQDLPPVLGTTDPGASPPASTMDAPADSSEASDARSLAAWSRRVPVSVRIPIEPASTGFRLTDSLMRWEPVATFFKSLDKVESPIRAYGFGTSGRTDALYRMADDPVHLRLTLEGLDLNDPVTGQPDLNRLSRRRTSVMLLDNGGGSPAALAAYDRLHHLTEPRMYLHFSEAGSTVRNLDVLYTHNLLRNLNMEIGYHDQRDGTAYSGMKVQGGELYGRAWIQWSEFVRMRFGWQSKKLDIEEPYGYTSADLSLFSFDPLTARPEWSGVKGVKETSDKFLQVDIRPASESSSFVAGLHHQTYRRSLSVPTDPVNVEHGRVELHARHALDLDWIDARSEIRLRSERLGGASMDGFDRKGDAASKDPQRLAIVSSVIGFQAADPVRMEAGGSVTRGADQATSHLMHAGVRIGRSGGAMMSLDVSRQSLAPSYQMRYWTTAAFIGRPDLAPETSTRAFAGLKLDLLDAIHVAAAVEWRRSESTPWKDPAGSARASDAYDVLSAHVSLLSDGRWFEAGADALWRDHQMTHPASSDPYVRRLDAAGPQMLIRGSAFIKGPVFAQAAYVKSGLVARLSPLVSMGPGFDPVLDRWEMGFDPRQLPSYLAVDARFSARLRWMMIHLEVENLLEGVGQAGYFETPGYPMPGRRWMFGLDVLFRN
jgi:hypothetical protein